MRQLESEPSNFVVTLLTFGLVSEYPIQGAIMTKTYFLKLSMKTEEQILMYWQVRPIKNGS